MSEWQSAETMPEREWVRVRGQGFVAIARFDGTAGELRNMEIRGGSYSDRRSVTEWMPLQEPPK